MARIYTSLSFEMARARRYCDQRAPARRQEAAAAADQAKESHRRERDQAELLAARKKRLKRFARRPSNVVAFKPHR